MRNLLAKREQQQTFPHARLNAVWYVDADSTYSVTKKSGSIESRCIAVRTLTGVGRMSLAGLPDLRLEANSLAIFPSDKILHYAAEPTGWQFYWFEFDMDAPPEVCAPVSIRLSAQERTELERCFTALGSSLHAETRMAESLFNYLLADWQLRAAGADKNGILRRKLLSLLEKGRRERLSVADLAREAGMSERGFRSAVHEMTGLSPKSYMLKAEMAAAMDLLRTTDMSVAEISACFNYNNPFYFSRVFKKYYGISPRQVRESIRL